MYKQVQAELADKDMLFPLRLKVTQFSYSEFPQEENT